MATATEIPPRPHGSVGYAHGDGGRPPLLDEVCDALDVDEDCNGTSDDDDTSVTGSPHGTATSTGTGTRPAPAPR